MTINLCAQLENTEDKTMSERRPPGNRPRSRLAGSRHKSSGAARHAKTLPVELEVRCERQREAASLFRYHQVERRNMQALRIGQIEGVEAQGPGVFPQLPLVSKARSHCGERRQPLPIIARRVAR
jgi:hypothetical protein